MKEQDSKIRKYLKIISKQYNELQKTYKKNKKNTDVEELKFLKQIIKVYNILNEKQEFGEIIEAYKVKYIYNESKVDEDITIEEQMGIGIVYDYIKEFDFEKDKFNIFITSLLIHQKLYSKCVGSDFGGNLRNSQVVLKDTNIEVVDAKQAREEFNKYINISDDIFEPLINNDILAYIENCIITIAKLIKLQPFNDGNKRTFRSLFNLLLKKINLPPVYIDNKDKKKYKEYLIKAMKDESYEDLIRFYYHRIYDAIIELDINCCKEELIHLNSSKIKVKQRNN